MKALSVLGVSGRNVKKLLPHDPATPLLHRFSEELKAGTLARLFFFYTYITNSSIHTKQGAISPSVQQRIGGLIKYGMYPKGKEF